MFDKFKKADQVEEQTDSLGGYSLFESGLYTDTVKLVFFGKSQSSDAQFAEIHMDIGGQNMSERIYFTNGKGENTYSKDGKDYFLPGFEMLNDLCLITTGSELVDLEDSIEEKTVKLYDYEAKKDLPKNVPCLTAVMGEKVTAAIIKQTVDKQKKSDATGNYENTGETRDENVFSKFFDVDSGMTVPEAHKGDEEATFIHAWDKKNTGVTRDRSKGVTNGSAPGRPQRSGKGSDGAAQKPKSSMFSKNK